LESGRHADGAKALRQALDLAPNAAAVVGAMAQLTTLARTWLMLGQAPIALASLAPLAQSEHAGAAVMALYGQALLAVGCKADAEAAFRAWLQKDPHHKDAALQLAAVLADEGKSAEAETLVRGAIARHGVTVETAFVLGRTLLGLARFDEAEAEFRYVVRSQPNHQMAQANLMELVWMRCGDVHESSRAIDDALLAQPQLGGLRITKSRLLLSARMPREALAELEAGMAIAPRDPALLAAASAVALEFDGSKALDYARRLQEASSPRDRAARIALGKAYLATGRGCDALEIAEAIHLSNPSDGQALALKADALRMLGDGRYCELFDYQNLVHAELIDVPEGWVNREAYVSELVDDLVRLHVLKAHPIGNSLREGSQIPLVPADSSFPSIRAFPRAIDGPVHRYIQKMGRGNDPMRRRNTGRYEINGIWSVRLRPHGFHVNHYHPGGWISSVCYLSLPPAVQRRGEGWLKFGEPAFPTAPALGPEYFLRPAPGLLVLFPSYMWHGTVPFSGGEHDSRMTIAFDAIPGG